MSEIEDMSGIEYFLTTILTKENITLGIALWGAALSTYKLVSEYRRDVRDVRVSLAPGFIEGGIGGVGPEIISITATNHGTRKVILIQAGFFLPRKNQRMILMEPWISQFPKELSEGESFSVYRERDHLVRELRQHEYSGKINLVGYFNSTIGKTYKSQKYPFGIERSAN